MWPGCFSGALSCQPSPDAGSDAAERLGAIIAALSALCQVQARLWAIPDKAEVLPGVSCSVSRTPVASLLVDCPGDVSPVELATVFCAARAAGVAGISVRFPDPAIAGRDDIAYVMRELGVGVESDPAEREIAIGRDVPRSGASVVIADAVADVQAVARTCRTILSAGQRLVVLTASSAVVAALPALLPDSPAVITLLHDDAEIEQALASLRPTLIVAHCESGRQLASRIPFASNFILGPLPSQSSVESLVARNAPLVPIHLLNRTLWVLAPRPARCSPPPPHSQTPTPPPRGAAFTKEREMKNNCLK